MAKRTTRKEESTGLKRIIFGKGPSRSHELHQEIAQRAYELFLQRGGTEGHAEEDWLQAERELRREEGQTKRR